ncbi:MAG: hypothetical protein AAB414_05115 [Patescibacteria group bacterium]
MAGPEGDVDKDTPIVRELIGSHHPDWSPDDVEELTTRATPAIVDFIDEFLDLPQDPNLSEPLFQQASDRFGARFLLPPKADQPQI